MIKVKNGTLEFKNKEEVELYLELGNQILKRDKNIEETYIRATLNAILEKDSRDRFAKYMLNNGWDYICHSITKNETVFIICNTDIELKKWMNETEDRNKWTVCINPRLNN